MGSYVPNTKEEQMDMLHSIGCESFEDLLKGIPEDVRLNRELDIPDGLAEMAVYKKVTSIAEKNKVFKHIYRGAGAYKHYIPSIVKQVTSKEEFITAYTPYQPEISQGVLQTIFEYQTMICELTGMDVSNASVYDGATAASEAVLMCVERKRKKMLVSDTVNPQIIETIRTLCDGISVELIVLKGKNGRVDLEHLKGIVDSETAGVLVQQPNYYGLLEDCTEIGEAVKEVGARYVIHCNPISLGLIKTPREYGADIAVGEGQPLGLPLSFGGPYLGFMATTKDLVRRLPGRIAGETKDKDGNRAFVLTLQAREQHIRREKASSNICSNQALCAMTAAVYLSAVGREGLGATANLCMAKAHYLANNLCELPNFSLRFSGKFFHEFVTDYKGDVGKLMEHLESHNILGGLPLAGELEGAILWCVTELNTREEMDTLIQIIKDFDR